MSIPTMQFISPDVLEVSHSSMMSFDSCPRKFEFRKFHMNSFRDETQATSSGQALHLALQKFAVTKDVDAGLFELVWNTNMQWAKSPMDARSLEACIAAYLHATRWDQWDVLEVATVTDLAGVSRPAIEVAFAIDIHNVKWVDGRTITVRYLGYIDFILFNRETHGHSVFDLKTTVKNEDMTVTYRWDEQCLPYGFVLQALLKVDIARSFDVNYLVNVIHHTEPQIKNYEFTKDRDDLEEWMRKLALKIAEMRNYVQLGWFPRKGNACMGFKRQCVNFDMCELRDTSAINLYLTERNQNVPREPIVPWVVVDLQLDGVK